MQNQAAGEARAVGFKRDLSIDNLVEELLFAFGINLEFRLPRGLCKELIAFPGNREDEVWRQLVLAHVAVENLGIDRYLFVLFGSGGRRSSLDPLSVYVGPVLVQGQRGRAPIRVSLKGDLCIDDFEEEVSLALRKTWALGCPVAWAKSWSPSRVTVRMNFGASWYRPT